MSSGRKSQRALQDNSRSSFMPMTVTPANLTVWQLDRLGVVIALLSVAGATALPFVIFKVNRIVLGDALSISAVLPPFSGIFLYGVIAAATCLALIRIPVLWRLLVGFGAVAVLAFHLGLAADFLTPDGNSIVRITPASGFWVMIFAYSLLVTDALVRLRLGPYARLGMLMLVGLAVAAALWGGIWQNLSILREYANRGDAFWMQARTHMMLSFGSLIAAALVGIPLGIFCYHNKKLRTAVLNILNMVQTIPSLALFGLLIAPLAWVAANIPFAAKLGISGIGFAPAMLALFGYSLLPIVANTLAGLKAAPETVKQAARGMGMTERQILLKAELPLALPVILTGIRIVLVQNIGLATIAALIGGGGFGVFVFQGIGQTAMDLVLLGAVPTVALAFAAAVILDALVELTTPQRTGNT